MTQGPELRLTAFLDATPDVLEIAREQDVTALLDAAADSRESQAESAPDPVRTDGSGDR